jgi:hypothetical protein
VIADNETSVTLDVSKFPAPNSVIAGLKKQDINIFSIDI